ncbi:unnamed protein product [Closterium sp. NIES-65]|nr:unnamed protein product [Closterium sp. NIES-65]
MSRNLAPCPHRTEQAFLLALGFSSELKEPYGTPRARRWQGMSVAQQRQMAERVEGESRAVSVRDLSAVEEASLLLQRAQGDKGYRNDSHIAAAMDNRGSPADMAGLLCKLTTARLLPWPRATALCLHTMAMQVYGQRRLPYYLPPALTVLHKTGSILGTVNAAGIIPLPRPPPALHSQHMRRHLTRLPLLPAVQASPRPSSPVTTLFSLPRSSAHLPGYEHAERGVGAESLQVSEGGAVVVAAFVDKVWRQHEREAEYVIARASKLAYDTWGERRRLRRMLSARERRRWMADLGTFKCRVPSLVPLGGWPSGHMGTLGPLPPLGTVLGPHGDPWSPSPPGDGSRATGGPLIPFPSWEMALRPHGDRQSPPPLGTAPRPHGDPRSPSPPGGRFSCHTGTFGPLPPLGDGSQATRPSPPGGRLSGHTPSPPGGRLSGHTPFPPWGTALRPHALPPLGDGSQATRPSPPGGRLSGHTPFPPWGTALRPHALPPLGDGSQATRPSPPGGRLSGPTPFPPLGDGSQANVETLGSPFSVGDVIWCARS